MEIDILLRSLLLYFTSLLFLFFFIQIWFCECRKKCNATSEVPFKHSEVHAATFQCWAEEWNVERGGGKGHQGLFRSSQGLAARIPSSCHGYLRPVVTQRYSRSLLLLPCVIPFCICEVDIFLKVYNVNFLLLLSFFHSSPLFLWNYFFTSVAFFSTPFLIIFRSRFFCIFQQP